MSVCDLARPEVAALPGYSTSVDDTAVARLNANEAFCSPWTEADVAALNRYPEMRPVALQMMLARLFGTSHTNVLPTRGSSEGIDLLIRTFCRAYKDQILITPPTFEMYRIYADMQAAGTVTVPLSPENDFSFSADAVLEACTDATKLLFLCSPHNPTGQCIPKSDILTLCEARAGKSVVVVDEAYVEFSSAASLAADTANIENLVVLRTLSKAYALAGARCGAVVGSAPLIELLGRVMSPYAFSTPVVKNVTQALGSGQVENAQRLIAEVVSQRQILLEELRRLPVTEMVWPSEANFVLVRFLSLKKAIRHLQQDGILVRAFTKEPTLVNCARITVGSEEENRSLLESLARLGVSGD